MEATVADAAAAGAVVAAAAGADVAVSDPTGADVAVADPSGADVAFADPAGADAAGADPTGADATAFTCGAVACLACNRPNADRPAVRSTAAALAGITSFLGIGRFLSGVKRFSSGVKRFLSRVTRFLSEGFVFSGSGVTSGSNRMLRGRERRARLSRSVFSAHWFYAGRKESDRRGAAISGRFPKNRRGHLNVRRHQNALHRKVARDISGSRNSTAASTVRGQPPILSRASRLVFAPPYAPWYAIA